MDTKNWKLKVVVACPDVPFHHPIRILARTIAKSLGIPCVVVSRWNADHQLWLSGTFQFHPKGLEISGQLVVNDRDFAGLDDDECRKFATYLGDLLLRNFCEFLHQEFRKKLGWTDEQKSR